MSKTIHNPDDGSFSTVKNQVLYNEEDGTAITIQDGIVISVDHPLPRPADFAGRPRRTPVVNTPEEPYIAPTVNYGDEQQVQASPSSGNTEGEQPYIAPTINYGDGSPSFAGATGSALMGHENNGEGETPYVAPTMDHSQAAVRSGSAITTLSR